MKITLEWQEGREARKSETELPSGGSWQELQEFIRQLARKAYKYSDEVIPEGLLNEGELL